MSRSRSLIIACVLLAFPLLGNSPAEKDLWGEYGLAATQVLQTGADHLTAYRMKDPTGAVAAWEWLRTANARHCSLGAFCSAEPNRTIVAAENYVLVFEGPRPDAAQFQSVFESLPGRRDQALSSLLNFLPSQGLVPNSARYVLGPASLQAFAPELAGTNPGFPEGAEAQVAAYRVANDPHPVHLALFYYPSPAMARLHMAAFEKLPGAYVKRSGVLIGVVFGTATPAQAQELLSRVQYEAKIVWDQVPPPSPVKPLIRLLLNIIYFCILLAALCIMAGLMYAGMRLYRRRFGTLEQDEAMTTLHLSEPRA
jgi:hypothetical protein